MKAIFRENLCIAEFVCDKVLNIWLNKADLQYHVIKIAKRDTIYIVVSIISLFTKFY